jgi:hypothetical protein
LEQRFNRDNLPADGWANYRKVASTPMVRIDGSFLVVTREGQIFCDDGWLALDAHGWPYPIAADEHAAVYVPADHPKLGSAW